MKNKFPQDLQYQFRHLYAMVNDGREIPRVVKLVPLTGGIFLKFRALVLQRFLLRQIRSV